MWYRLVFLATIGLLSTVGCRALSDHLNEGWDRPVDWPAEERKIKAKIAEADACIVAHRQALERVCAARNDAPDDEDLLRAQVRIENNLAQVYNIRAVWVYRGRCARDPWYRSHPWEYPPR